MVLFDDRQVYSKQAHFSKEFGVMFSPYTTLVCFDDNSSHGENTRAMSNHCVRCV